MKQIELQKEIERQIGSWYLEWRRVNRLYTAWAAQYGISDTALWVLQTLYGQEGPVTQRSVCAQMNLPKQTVSCVLAALEKKGVLSRVRSEEDRRNSFVALTSRGRAWTAELLAALNRAEREAFGAIGSRDRAAFTRVNSLLTDHLTAALAQTGDGILFSLDD